MKTLIPFHELFPELIDKETRFITILNDPVIPDDQYILVEVYCPDPNCNCRRVQLKVIAKENTKQGELVTISFGFERDKELAGPYIDPLNPRCSYAGALFKIVAPMLEKDSQYVDRLKSHYHMVKQAVTNPTPRVKRALARYNFDFYKQTDSRKELRRSPRISRTKKKKRKKRKK